MAKNKIMVWVKVLSSAFLSFAWLILIQAEYEMMTKPELRHDFPVVKGTAAVLFLGLILLVMAAVILGLLHSLKKSWKAKG